MAKVPPGGRLTAAVTRFAAVPSRTEVLPLVKQWREFWQSH